MRLTIAIPTFQRAHLLAETLDSVDAATGSGLDAQVEVLVVDNASLDETRGVAARYRDRLPGFRYERQDTNVGGEANFYSCFERARGEFVWIVGDDDVVVPEAVGHILSALDRGAGAVVVNHSVWSADMGTCHRPTVLPATGDAELSSHDAALSAFGGGLSFTATVVLPREAVVRGGREAFLRRAALRLAFLDSAYRALAAVRRIAYLSQPLVRARGGNSRGDAGGTTLGWSAADWDAVFIAGLQQVLGGLREYGYGAAAIRAARGWCVRIYVPERLRLMRREGQPCGPTVRQLLRHAADVPATWTRALPMLAMPRFLLRHTPRLKRRFR